MTSELSPESKSNLIQSYLASGATVPENPPPYPTSIFPDASRQILTMIYSILGYDDDQKVDEVILGLMLALGSSKTVPVMFYYYKFLADSINLQLVQFSTTRSFIFKSYLLYLFLFSQVNQFAKSEVTG